MSSLDGSVLDEIDELTRLNREQPDPARERRLVQLRNAAFDDLDRTPGRPSWPPDLADPFPGVIGIPRIDSTDVSAEVIGGAIVHHGCIRVDGLLDPETARRFRDCIEEAFAARQRVVDGSPMEAAAPWWVPFEKGEQKPARFGAKGFVRTVDVPRALFELVEAFERTGVRDAVGAYFNERPAMIANKWVLRRSPSGLASTDYHQDGAFLGDAIRTVDCWIALSDCGPGTGRPAMDVVPHRFEIIPPGEEGATFSWSLTAETVERLAGSASIESPSFAVGDALFFDERLPHRTSVGTDLTTRYAIESWFVAPSSYPGEHVPVVL
jgi:hypothetical protein